MRVRDESVQGLMIDTAAHAEECAARGEITRETMALALARAGATLRMAAAAWPSEPVRPPRPQAVREAARRVERARSYGDVARTQTLADALDDIHETGRRLGFEQGLAKGQKYAAAGTVLRYRNGTAERVEITSTDAADLPYYRAPAADTLLAIHAPDGHGAVVSYEIGTAAAEVVRQWADLAPDATGEVCMRAPALADMLDALAQAFRDRV